MEWIICSSPSGTGGQPGDMLGFWDTMGLLKVSAELITLFREDRDDFNTNVLIDRKVEVPLGENPGVQEDSWWNYSWAEAKFRVTGVGGR